MPQRVAGNSFAYAGVPCSFADGLLQAGFMDVVPARFPGPGVRREAGGGKNELPHPLFLRAVELSRQRRREQCLAVTGLQILPME